MEAAQLTAAKDPSILITNIEETRASVDRPTEQPQDDVHDPGGVDVSDDKNVMKASGDAPVVSNQDYWSIQGDYLIRTHNRPRTLLFSPLEVPDDLPPIDSIHLEVSRTTKPIFSGQQWPTMELIEDCWTGRPSDARPLLKPDDGSTLSWTGETIFERVLPAPPKGQDLVWQHLGP